MSTNPTPTIDPGTSVREIMTKYPSAEAIFERHGLLGCGGPNGPREPVAFFARVHRVNPTILLTELNEHVSTITKSPPPPRPAAKPVSVSYPIFIITSLVLAILAGFTTGMAALASQSLNWAIPGLNLMTLIQVHGRFQLYGWAGLFVFGVAFHVVPRFIATPLARPRLAMVSFGLVVAGLILSVGQAITPSSPTIPHLAFILGVILLLAAAATFVFNLILTVRSSEQPITMPIYLILIGASWLVIGSALELVVALGSVPGLPLQPILEEPALVALLEGFLVTTALGVSMRTLPVFAGARATHQRPLLPTVISAQAALVVLVVGAALYGQFGQQAIGQPLMALGAVGFFAAVAVYVWALRIFEPSSLPVAEMGTGWGWLRAIRYAYVWLIIGLTLQAVAAVQAMLSGVPIPWGTLGAARHALALGFVSILIVGMASRVVPVFAGKPLWKAWLVDVAAVLLVTGTAIRVILEIATPYGTGGIAGILLTVSGPIAYVGLVAFAVNFIITMVRRDILPAAAPTATTTIRRVLRGDDLLAEALRRPGGAGRLVELGLAFLSDPGQRALAARSLTIAHAAQRAKVDPDWLLEQLNRSEPGTASSAGSLLPTGGQAAAPIDPDRTVADVLDAHPTALAVFLRHGFTPLANPDLRKQLAPTITVRQAALNRGVDLETLLAELRQMAGPAGELTVKE